MELKWNKDMSIGNAIIDAEHRNLIRMVNDVIRGIRTRNIPSLLDAFELLEGWLHSHAANEETLARAVDFPFEEHKLAQQHALKELQYLRDELAGKNGLWSDSATGHFIERLKSWMLDEHIANLDMRMKPALEAHDYHFWPNWEKQRGGTKGYAPPKICGCGCGCDQTTRTP